MSMEAGQDEALAEGEGEPEGKHGIAPSQDCTHGIAPTELHPSGIAPNRIAPSRIAPRRDCTHGIAPTRDCTHTEFQYDELTFTDQVNTDHYNQFKKILKNVKQNQENWHKKGLDELSKLAQQPHDIDLLEQTKTTKLMYIHTSKKKLDQISSNYNELVKAHTVFSDSLNKVKITVENNSNNETPTVPPVAQKFVNRQDLAKKCSTLSANNDLDAMNEFEDNFNS